MIRLRHILVAAVCLTSTSSAAPMEYAPVHTANPLKGFMPYSRGYGPDALPHSMEFFYLPLKDLMDGPERFTWQKLDDQLDSIASRGHQAVFRVYLDYPKKAPGTPDFLRHGPDGIPGTTDDLEMRSYQEHGNNGVSLSPDYTCKHLLAAMKNFIAALGKRYDGDPRIGFLQLGLLGFWGEWHTYPHKTWFPPLAIQEEILAAFDTAFNQTRLLVREPKATSYRNYDIGYHDDSFAFSTLAPPDWHFSGKLATHGESDRWKTQPIGGEIRPENQPGMWQDPSSVPLGQDFDLCVAALHPSWMLAYGPFTQDLSPAARQLAEKQSRSLGYEFFVATAAIEASSTSHPVHISASLRNTGVAPFYYAWPIELAVMNDARQLIHTARLNWTLTNQIPGDPDRAWSHAIPADTLPPGKFKLLLRVVNPLDSGMPLRFANTTQDADLAGWITLGKFTL